MKKVGRKMSSLLAVAMCIVLATPTVYAYPIKEQVNSLNSTMMSNGEITDVETTVYKSEYSNAQYAYSPAICVTKSGRIIVSYDINGETGAVKYSDNGGVTFSDAKFQNAEDEKFLFGNVFETETGVYLMARRYSTGSTNGQLIIFKSTDNGANWSSPVTIDEGVWHTAPSEVMYLDGYVYLTWEAQDSAAAQAAGGAGRGILAPVVLKGSVTADLSVASNWTISDTTLCYYDAINGNTWERIDYMGLPLNRDRYSSADGSKTNVNYLGWLEGNIVRITDTNNELYDPDAICHIFLRSSAGSADYANIMKIVVDDDGNMVSEMVTTPSGKTLLYAQIPGGQSKFSINYDETSGLYWLVSNVSTDSMAIDTTMGAGASTSRHEGPHDIRNVLGLYYSENAMDWEFAGIVSRTDSIDQARSYASMEISGNDLLVVSRSGDEEAVSGHNTNLILLHRIKNFRKLVTDATVTTEAKNPIANSNGTVFYDASVLQDESVGDTHTFVTAGGTTIVTCAISDDEGTESKVLVKNADGYYAQTLTASYKLGEAFEVNGALNVFGVADKELVAFKSTNEGATWTAPAVIDNTRNWYEAPTSTLINDDQIMLALSELQESSYQIIRGYAGEMGSMEQMENGVRITGYGGVTYTEAFDLEVGESVSVTVSPKTLQSGQNNKFAVLFGDTMGSFYGNPADTGNGVAFELRSFGNYTSGANVWYGKVTAGVLGTQIGMKNEVNSSNVGGDLTQNTYTIKLTRVADADYPWVMSMKTTANAASEYSYRIPATDLAANAFENGLYLLVANAGPQLANMCYEVTKPVVTETATTSTEAGEWTKYVTSDVNYNGTMVANNKEVTITGRTAAYYSQAIPVKEGTKISYDVTFPTIVSNATIQYALSLATHQNAYYIKDATTATAILGMQLVGTSANGDIRAQGEYSFPSTGRKVAVAAQIVTSDWTTVGSKTYRVTFTKQANTSANSWVMTVGDGTKTVTINMPASVFAHDLFDATGAYITVGSATGSAHAMKISNLTVEQEGAANWSALRGYSGTAGSVSTGENQENVLTGYGAVKYNESYKLSPGESVSVTISPKALQTSVNNKFAIMFGDTANSHYANAADTGNGVSFELRSFGNYTTGGNIWFGKVTAGVLGTQTAILNSVNSQNIGEDMTQNTYTVKLTRTWDAAFPWTMSVTTSANTSEYIYKIPADTLAEDAFNNGVYITAANMFPQNAVMVYHISDVAYDSHIATATETDAYKVSPVVMVADLTADLTAASSWSYMNGISLSNKVGSAYANTKMNFFGLPYEEVDVRTIGWTDLKLFELCPTDDIRYDATTGNVFGYMTFTKAGYNYAAFVKVNTSTNAIEFFRPESQVNGVAEEEFVFAKLPGGNNGFDILYDSVNELYWLVTTVNTDTVNATDKSAAKIAVYHSKNAYDWTYGGKVADVSGDARVSAAFSGDDMVITAVDGGVVNYVVSQYEKLADVCNWTAQRGYNSATNGSMTVEGNTIILDGYGAATCGTNIVNKENTEITVKVKATDLTVTGSYFSLGLVDTEGSFFGSSTDKGNGFVISILPWGSHNGAAYRYSVVTKGSASPAIANGALVGGSQVGAEMVNNEITVKFIKRTQEISNVTYTWIVEITDKNGNNVRTMNIPASDVGADLFADGCYLIAGCCNNKDVTYEITGAEVKQSVTGDINGDGEINIKDIAITDYKYRITGGDNNKYQTYENVIYDINGDGQCNTKDVDVLRMMVLQNEATSDSGATAGATMGKVRLERKYYQKNGKDMTDITINTDFVCGGMEGIFTYDSTQLTYQGMSCRISSNIRNNETLAIDNGAKGLMVVALGNAKYGTKGNIITLTFEGQIKEWDQFSMESAVFVGVDGTEQFETVFYDVLLGDVTEEQKDFEINAKDLIRMKHLIKNGETSMNADLNRDNKDVPDDADCELLREYLCEKITEF